MDERRGIKTLLRPQPIDRTCAVARCWQDVLNHAVEPGRVARMIMMMSGAVAPGDSRWDNALRSGWLSAIIPAAAVGGRYCHHR
jgi:hypothetical protein